MKNYWRFSTLQLVLLCLALVLFGAQLSLLISALEADKNSLAPLLGMVAMLCLVINGFITARRAQKREAGNK